MHNQIKFIATIIALAFISACSPSGNETTDKSHIDKIAADVKQESNVISGESSSESSKANNRNAYPIAMAEKRALSRAILKLTGYGGIVYGEDEIDE